MKNNKIFTALVILLLGLCPIIFSSYSAGIFGQSTSGCGGGGCHNSSSGTSISITGIPTTGFTPGNTYTLSLNVTNGNYATGGAGFNLTVNQGTLVAGSGSQLNGSQEIAHSGMGAITTANTVTWVFHWTAPNATTTPLTMNIAGNMVNGNGQPTNDAFNTTSINFPIAPVVNSPNITLGAISFLTDVSAQVNALVTANNASTTVQLEYGTTTAYGTSLPMSPSPVTGSAATSVTGTISGLTPNTTYHYRVVANNSVGTTNSIDDSFRTNYPNLIFEIDNNAYRLYPNPAGNKLTLSMDQIIKEMDLSIYNLKGQKVFVHYSQINNKKIELDMSSLNSGNYFLYAIINKQRLIKKIQVQ